MLFCCALSASLLSVRARLAALPFFRQTRTAVAALAPGAALRLTGTVGSLPACLLADLYDAAPRLIVVLAPTHEAALLLRSDLDALLGPDAKLLVLPPSGQPPYDPGHVPDPQPLIQRADALQQLRDGFDGLLLASAEALAERVTAPEALVQQTLVLKPGDPLEPQRLLHRLVEQGFEVVEFVSTPGEAALRGGILDVFPFAGTLPLRIEFFGDEIDTLRSFDPGTQRSVETLTQARIVPNLESDAQAAPLHTPFFTYLQPNTPLVLLDDLHQQEVVQAVFDKAEAAFHGQHGPTQPPPAQRYLDGRAWQAATADFPCLLLGTFASPASQTLALTAHAQPAFNGDMARFREHLADLRAQGVPPLLLCDSPTQRKRLAELLTTEDGESLAESVVASLHEGFAVPEAQVAVYTDHQLFNRYHRPQNRTRKAALGGLTLRELKSLKPGDFVVHIDHGVGKFAGLVRIKVRERVQEAVKLRFQEGDELLVNVSALHKLHKYSGKEGHQPKLTKLGSGQWDKVKARTKKRVKDIARDLIRLYAQRKASKGYAFGGDTVWQRELEAAFPYEDTPDQGDAAEAVKRDMEQPTPMDRLVCGDVGFGKTEIAVRAAFKAVQEGKQVAVIVPTTILAAQHVETFMARMARFPVRIAQLSRFVGPAEQKAVLQRVAAGEIDILIGTQRILSKDVRYKDLGLLVVDEEQKFGVGAKEKLRQIRPNVDTLTLTATPIPRTLQFSLMGARDLSIIATPPPNRQPITTEIHTYNPELIRDALLYETQRGGQSFFIHNRVMSIEQVADTLRELVPGVRIRTAHGQMAGDELEDVMLAFQEQAFDVLVCTNIVESGLDVSNANTILINHAETFGLSDLHQLRGRVGRRDQRAFCYLLVPSIHAMTREARQRLQAVEEFADLGSGFQIAMRDLDIRGAGTLLGAEQSGFIEDVGYETYHQILDEAVRELRAEEFADLFDTPPAPVSRETQIDLEADAFLPETYVGAAVERLNLYRRLAELDQPADLDGFRQELADRFGPLPDAATALLLAARLKLLAQPLRLTRLQHKNERLWLDFPKQEEDPYFYQHLFHPLLERLASLQHRYVLRDSDGGRLRAILQDVPDLPTVERLVGTLAALAPESILAEARST